MRRSEERIRTTHVGSLPRDPDLRALLLAKNAGEAVQAEPFAARVREAVRAVVTRQARTGLDMINDGEQGRVDYTAYVADRLSGFGGETTPVQGPPSPYPEWPGMARSLVPANLHHPACDGPLAWRDFPALEYDIGQVQAAASDLAGSEDESPELFMTAVSPGQIARFLENRYYPTEDAYLEALAEVMRREYEAIVAAGLVLQLDCPDLALGYEYAYHDRSYEDFRSVVARHVEVLNAATANIPPERMRMHVCWASTGGPHDGDIPLREIAAEIVKARPQAIAVAGANPRHAHEWRVWAEVALPDDKILIPGVIDTTTNFIEHPELVADRIERYANVLGRERVIAGGDCGFGTFADRVQVDREIVWRKLESLVAGARIASERLWGRS